MLTCSLASFSQPSRCRFNHQGWAAAGLPASGYSLASSTRLVHCRSHRRAEGIFSVFEVVGSVFFIVWAAADEYPSCPQDPARRWSLLLGSTVEAEASGSTSSRHWESDPWRGVNRAEKVSLNPFASSG